MEWVAILATLGIVVLVGATGTVAVLLLRHHKRVAATALLPDEDLFGADVLDLEATFNEVAAEGAQAQRRLIALHLDLLRSHRVPLRRVYASPDRAVARLGFADGTVLLARSRSPGDLPTVVRLQQRGGMVVSEYAEHPDGLVVQLTSTRGGCTLIAVGLDQAD